MEKVSTKEEGRQRGKYADIKQNVGYAKTEQKGHKNGLKTRN